MKAEFKKLLELYEELEEAGETATLTLSTRGGKSTIKLQLESSPSPPATSTTPSNTLPPASGRRRRHRGARARARRNQRAAAHQAEAAASAPLAPPPRLRLLPSPPPDSGRRRVMSCVSRLPSFSNLDGAPPSSPPCSPPPAPAEGWPPTKEEVVDDDFPVVVLCPPSELRLGEFWRGKSGRLGTRYSTPPPRVKHPVRGLVATYMQTDPGGRYMYRITSTEIMYVVNPA